jgi:hypothetical protein
MKKKKKKLKNVLPLGSPENRTPATVLFVPGGSPEISHWSERERRDGGGERERERERRDGQGERERERRDGPGERERRDGRGERERCDGGGEGEAATRIFR